MKMYVGVIRDHSGSVSSIANKAMEDYNSLVTDLRKNSIEKEIDTIVSVVECGIRDGYSTVNRLVVKNSSVLGLKTINQYPATGNSTPLFDAIGLLIDSMMDVPDAKDPDVCFFINVITDGEENASRKYLHQIPETIRELQNTDRWTFAFRVPRGYRTALIRMGIAPGNILEWEQSNAGFEKATEINSKAIGDFYASASLGNTSTRSFYSTDLAGVSAQKISNSLVDITNEVEVYQVPMSENGNQIRDFVEKHRIVPMKKGSAFYQLTKKEDEVQDYKQILIRDKKSHKVYGGVHARQLLGLPFTGTVKIVPGNHGNYDIFIQSTSVNRKLVGGTNVLYWDKVGEVYKNQQSAPVAAPTPKVDPKQERIRGYVDGFDHGKAKLNRQAVTHKSQEYQQGYDEGYKHGRGKKKRLYSRADLTQ